MKTLKHLRLAGLMLTGCFGMLSANTVFAAAGDSITNDATLSYAVGGVGQTDITSAAVTLTEDRLLDIDVAAVGGTTQVAASATGQVLTFDITNDGNGTQDVLLLALQNGGDNFDVTSQVFVEDGTTAGTYQVAEDTDVFVDELAAGATIRVYVVSTVPGGVTDGDIANVTLVTQVAAGGAAAAEGAAIIDDNNGNASPATVAPDHFSNGATASAGGAGATDVANTAAGAAEPVFGDLTVGTLESDGTADTASNGQFSADNTYTVIEANVSVVKTQSVIWDPVNGNSNPKAIPGAYVQYTVTISNAGGASGAADLTTITDDLVAELDLDPDFVTNAGPGNPTNAAGDSVQITHVDNAVTNYCTGAADADSCGYVGTPGGVLTVNILTEMGATDAEIDPGESVTVRFNAIIQ